MLKLIDKIFSWGYPLFKKWGLDSNLASYLGLAINLIILCVLSYLIYYGFKYILVRTLIIIARKTKSKFDDFLVTNKTAKYTAHLIPLLFIYKSVPFILEDFENWEKIFVKLVEVYIVLLFLWIIRTVFNALRDHLKQTVKYSDKPIDSYIQVIMIVLWIFGTIYLVSALFEIDSNSMLATLGAVSAVIILIFRDTILGFVASVQVSLNDMVRIGDWITFDKFGADGDVIEINLATVKVRNFDNTTTTIPTYSMISDSFRNWRGMLDSDGRRIKRHLLIKTKSIRFLNEEDLEQLKRIQLIKPYLEIKQSEIDKYNTNHDIDKTLAINGRNLTNFGLFRKYITLYLENHSGLNKEMLLICRQLQPTQHGIPLEIYAFTNNKKFENYEYIMADIFDHIFASINYFDLEIFELPTSGNNVDLD
jgi:miniconductance mechanosensitive channel